MDTKIRSVNSSTALLIITGFIFILHDFQLSAQEPVPDSIVKERIEFIQKMLNEGKPAASLWWNGWLYGYGAATLVQGSVFLTSNQSKTRQDMALGAATTFVGLAGQLIMPMVPVRAAKKLTAIPGESVEQRIAKLQQAEELFESSASREIQGRSWKMHAASGVVNLSSGMITWLGFNRSVWAGIGNFVLNTAICEAQILTQPMKAARNYNIYCERYKSGFPQTYRTTDLHLVVNAFPGGISLKFIF